MTDYSNLYNAVRRIAWGYVLIFFDINLATISILPKWAGYLMIISSLAVIGEYVSSAKLLRPLGIFLSVYFFFEWVATIFSLQLFDIGFLTVIVIAVRIYFSFQLFTDIAELSKIFAPDKTVSLLKFRTAFTITDTLLMFALNILSYTDALSKDIHSMITIAIAIIGAILAIIICGTIFSFSKRIASYEEERLFSSPEMPSL